MFMEVNVPKSRVKDGNGNPFMKRSGIKDYFT